MLLIEHDHMIEQVASDTANNPFAVAILPRTPWRNLYLFEADVLDTLLKMITVDAVPVPEQVSRCALPGTGVNDLLGRPRKIPLGAPQLAVGRKAGQPVGLLQSWYGVQSKRSCRL